MCNQFKKAIKSIPFFIFYMNCSFAQNVEVQKIDSLEIFNGRLMTFAFYNLLKSDSLSPIQILLLQFDNKNVGKVESYLYKIDALGVQQKITFSDFCIKSKKITKCDSIDPIFSGKLTNQKVAILSTSNEIADTYPSCLIIKRYNQFEEYYFLNTNVERVVNSQAELSFAKIVFVFIKKQFDIKIGKITDG